jgi:hypothetical protein
MPNKRMLKARVRWLEKQVHDYDDALGRYCREAYWAGLLVEMAETLTERLSEQARAEQTRVLANNIAVYRRELKPRHVLVFDVLPGWVEPPMLMSAEGGPWCLGVDDLASTKDMPIDR